MDNASYPTEKIARNSHDFRPLGIGYANLGALLMSLALPYDSDGGRDFCGAITALMTGESYAQSARIAERMGPFGGYLRNREPMLEVIRMHRDSLRPIKEENVQPSLLRAAQESWDDALELGEKFGYKNSQVSVLAPTGTIGFMMDCDTTGIEPDLALVKQKRLVGGGVIKIVNNTVPQALMKLGYPPEQVAQIVDYIDAEGKIEGAPGLKPEHLPVFDCSLTPMGGGRSIAWRGHLQDDGGGAAVSLRRDQQDDQHARRIHGRRHHRGLHRVLEAGPQGRGHLPRQFQALAAAFGRRQEGRRETRSRGCRRRKGSVARGARSRAAGAFRAHRARRKKLQNERNSITHKFSIGGHEGYLTVGKYEDGTPGEIFIKMAKEGSTLSGIMDAFALSVSIALQYGVPLRALVDKFVNSRFEPSGYTGNPEIRYAKSIVDYIGRWLGGKFISRDYLDADVIEETVAPGCSGSRRCCQGIRGRAKAAEPEPAHGRELRSTMLRPARNAECS